MIQTILIVLVAVVVLIVIIAVLALRYLRADDSDTFDDIPDEPRQSRRLPELDRERRLTPPGRRPRQPEQVTEAWAAARPARTPDARVPAGYPDRDPAARQTGPQRAAAPRRSPSAPRPARATARPDGPDTATGSWDSLSDVDYWAELAADKPEVTPPDSRTASGARRGPEAASDIRPAAARRAPEPTSDIRPATARRAPEPTPDIRPAAGRPGGRADSGQFPVPGRQSSRPSQPSRMAGAPSARATDTGQTQQIDVRASQPVAARYNGDPAVSSPDVLGRHSQPRPAMSQRPDTAAAQPQRQRPAGSQRPASPRQAPVTPAAPAALPGYDSRPPAPTAAPYSNGHGRGRGDDDPLTSPSFPAITTSDSRSYRTQRSSSGQHTRPPAAQGTGHQYIDYSSAPRRAASQPDGYPVQQAAPPAEAPAQPATSRRARHRSPAAPAASAAPPAAPPTNPAANPYGSYVSDQPQPGYSEPSVPQSGYASAGYPEMPAPSLAGAAYSGYAAGQQAGSAGWNGGQPTEGYLPAAGSGGTGRGGGSHAHNGSQSRGYAGIDYGSLRYDDPVYPDAAGALPGNGSAGQHATQYDQQGYGTPDPGSGPDAYQAYPGYGARGR